MANEPLPAMARGRPGQAAGSALRERQHHRRSGRLGLLTGLLTVLSLVVLSPGGSQRAAQAQGRAEVAIIDGAFLPASILVQAGDTVIWANIGTVTHTVTADDGSFASGPLAPGARFRQTFPAAGLVTYYCALHPQMLGAITVTAAPAPGGGSTATRLPGTGVGTTAPSALLPMALLALLVATGLSTQATLVRCRTR